MNWKDLGELQNASSTTNKCSLAEALNHLLKVKDCEYPNVKLDSDYFADTSNQSDKHKLLAEVN